MKSRTFSDGAITSDSFAVNEGLMLRVVSSDEWSERLDVANYRTVASVEVLLDSKLAYVADIEQYVEEFTDLYTTLPCYFTLALEINA